MVPAEPTGGVQRPAVLVVDDSAVMRTALVAALEAAERWRVLPPSADGRAAVAQARATCPDVIVLDQQMPILTGLETAPLLRELCPKAHIVMWSSDPEVESLAARAGINAFVDKAEPMQRLLDAMSAPQAPG